MGIPNPGLSADCQEEAVRLITWVRGSQVAMGEGPEGSLMGESEALAHGDPGGIPGDSPLPSPQGGRTGDCPCAYWGGWQWTSRKAT